MNTLNLSQLTARANAEGISFAAIKAAIIERGNALRTDGWVKPPKELLNMTSSDVLEAIYPHYRSAKIDGSYAFGHLIRWPADRAAEFLRQVGEIPNGTRIECYLQIQDEIHLVLVEKKGRLLKVVAEYDHFYWEVENCSPVYLPPGIRAAVAKKIGAEISSSTFHGAFDAVVDGYAIY